MMKRIVRLAALAVGFGLAAADSLRADDALKASVEKRAAPEDVAEPMRKLLGAEAVNVADFQGPLVSIWLRSVVPANATPEQMKNGLTYREIPFGTFLGVIELKRAWIDFRKQEIPRGVYTLRLAVQPMDGDHMGTAPGSDFLLLSPASADLKPDELSFKALTELSAAAHDSTHPAALLLLPHSKPREGVAIVDKGNGIQVLRVKLPVEAEGGKTALGFGLVLRGHSPTR